MSGFMMAATATECFAAAASYTKPAAVATTSNTILGAREQAIASIAAFTANDEQDELKKAVIKALEQGMTVNEIKDVMEQMYAYCGFPRSLNALGTLMSTVQERKDQGITDEVGREATPLPAGTDILKQGTATQTEVCGTPVTGPLFEFSPNIDTYLKAHLFGDIFASDLLTHKDREIATIAALASLPAPVQLRSHYEVSMNVGWTEDQLKDFVKYMQQNVGEKEGAVAQSVLDELLSSKK